MQKKTPNPKKALRKTQKSPEKSQPAENELRESEDRFHLLLQHVPSVAVQGYSMDGTTHYWNEASERIYGYTAQEAIGRNLLDLIIPPEMREDVQKAIASMVETGQPIPAAELSLMRKDGTRAPVFSSHAIVKRPGAPPELFCIDIDLTDRKKAEDARRETVATLKALMENIRQGVLFENASRSIQYANRTFCEFFGMPSPDLLLGVDCGRMAEQAKHAFADPEGFILTIEHRLAERKPVLSEELLLADGRIMERDYIPVLIGREQAGTYWIYRDISDRRQADTALKQSEARLRHAQRLARIGNWTYDVKSGELWWSDELLAMFGIRPEDGPITRERFFTCVHPDDRPTLEAQIASNLPHRSDYRALLPDGKLLYIHEEVELQCDEKGNAVSITGTAQDITEQKLAEDALRAREKQLAESQRIAHIGSWEHNVTTGEVFWSDELFRLLGLDLKKDPADFKMFFEMIHPDDRPALKNAVDETVKSGKHFSIEYRFVFRDGTTRIIHAQAELIRNAAGDQAILSGTAQDITERKKAEAELRESEKRLRTLIDAIPDAVLFKDTEGRHIIANRANEEVLGLSPEMLIGKTAEDLLPPEFAAVCRKNDEEVMKNQRTVRCEEIATDKAGNKKIHDTIKVPLYDDNGSAIGLVGIIRDVTERKLAEEKIRQSEQFIRNIHDTVDEGIIVIDRDYLIMTANRAYCAQAGRSGDEVIGRHCFEVSHKTSRPCFDEGEDCAVRRVFATGEPHAALHKHRDRDGQVLYVETRAFPIRDNTGRVTSAIETINNITEKHLLEEERLKTQKLESIGTLAGGIAHDFNNLLQGIFGFISMAKLTIDQREKSLAMLEQAEKALHQSVNLTTQLLTFSKGGKPVRKPILLAPVITSSVEFGLSGSRSSHRLNVDPDLWPVDGDAGQLAQVIQNIVLNADQSMPLGGCVQITARNIAPSDARLPHGLKKQDHVEIEIRDSGVGIPEQYLDKIFDPYFTTKEKGSGLGLATSYSIVRNHDGQILVQSEVGKGTTITIYLPALEEAPESLHSVEKMLPSMTKALRVLVMDDEELIRKLVTELLRALGHEVEVARHGNEAVEKYRAAMTTGRPFDVVILDLTIRGGMGGTETLQKLREMDASVKAVVSSGYADNAVLSGFLDHGFKAGLKKPYDIHELQAVLTTLMV